MHEDEIIAKEGREREKGNQMHESGNKDKPKEEVKNTGKRENGTKYRNRNIFRFSLCLFAPEEGSVQYFGSKRSL